MYLDIKTVFICKLKTLEMIKNLRFKLPRGKVDLDFHIKVVSIGIASHASSWNPETY